MPSVTDGETTWAAAFLLAGLVAVALGGIVIALGLWGRDAVMQRFLKRAARAFEYCHPWEGHTTLYNGLLILFSLVALGATAYVFERFQDLLRLGPLGLMIQLSEAVVAVLVLVRFWPSYSRAALFLWSTAAQAALATAQVPRAWVMASGGGIVALGLWLAGALG